jgi:hypothetical protein
MASFGHFFAPVHFIHSIEQRSGRSTDFENGAQTSSEPRNLFMTAAINPH